MAQRISFCNQWSMALHTQGLLQSQMSVFTLVAFDPYLQNARTMRVPVNTAGICPKGRFCRGHIVLFNKNYFHNRNDAINTVMQKHSLFYCSCNSSTMKARHQITIIIMSVQCAHLPDRVNHGSTFIIFCLVFSQF